jgi:CelD/BcsL family acetyltransferase involved in cellulose biosynthesis
MESSPGKDEAMRDGQSAAWDLIEWTGIQADDPIIDRLVGELAARGGMVHWRPGMSCWRIALQDSLEGFLSRLSRDHRKKLRETTRKLIDSGRAVLRTARDMDQLARGEKILIDLHQRRRQALGDVGRFASPRFAGFHREMMRQLLLAGQLRLHWIELDGRPVAAEYQIASGDTVYAYQSGIEPEALDQSPGRLAHLLTIRRAIQEGYRTFDFLRGDEPYKAHWRAEPWRTVEIRIAAPRASSRLRHGLWLAASGVHRWLKRTI